MAKCFRFLAVWAVSGIFLSLHPSMAENPPTAGEVNRIDINSAKAIRAGSYMVLPSRGLADPHYEDSSRQLHPSILVIPEGWPTGDKIILPWKQWLAVTPMATSDADENPHLLVRNDPDDEWTYLIGRDTIDSIINPLFRKSRFILDTAYWYSTENDTSFYDTTDGHHDSVTVGHRSHHLSDPDLFMGNDGFIWMAFRVSWSVSGIDMHAIYAARSQNGKDWQDIHRITHLGRFMCPAVICENDSSFTMFCTTQKDRVSGIVDETSIYRFGSVKPDTIWNYYKTCKFTNTPRQFRIPWHLDVLSGCDDYYVAIIQTIERSALWLAISRDNGGSWTIADQPILKSVGNDLALWDNILYRASGYWMDDQCHALGLYYSAYHVADTNGISPGGENTLWHTGFTVVEFDRTDGE